MEIYSIKDGILKISQMEDQQPLILEHLRGKLWHTFRIDATNLEIAQALNELLKEGNIKFELRADKYCRHDLSKLEVIIFNVHLGNPG